MIATTACLLAVVLAMVGAELPVDTTFIEALPFWLTIVATTAFLLTMADQVIDHAIRDMKFSRPFLIGVCGLAAVLLVTIPLALMCLPIDFLIPDSDSLFGTLDNSDPLSALFWGWADQYLNLLPAVAGFWLFIRALDLVLPVGIEEARVLSHAVKSIEISKPSDTSSLREPSPLERRFPDIAGKVLHAIEADEHYIRLHMEACNHHVLYRFRDALKDVEDLRGLRVHRSWWVAEDAILDLEQSGSSFGLKLRSGLIVPVSQTYRRDVERIFSTLSRTA